jgi:signal transduction histidine kinase
MAVQLKKSMEEERLAVQAKNELITNVSHDLRTPLTSIIGYLRLIEDDRYKDEVELRYYTNIAYEKSRRLERMVNDLFEYTKISYGENVLKRSDINLNELIGQLAADFSLLLAEADMEIRLSFQQEKVIIVADGDMLMRALENLLSNAIKYGKHGRHIDVDVQLASDSVHIRIINYGQSIPSSDLTQIFDRFYRVEKSRSEETGGSGIGLAIVKSIIELHQGSITVSSTERQTVFEVTLPLNESTMV